MGFFDFVGGVIDSVGSFLSDVGSSICSALGSIASSIWEGISTVLNSDIGREILTLAGSLLAPILGMSPVEIVNIVMSVCKIVELVSNLVGIDEENDDNSIELGMKAKLYAEKPENFDNITDYINHLKTDISLDNKDVEHLTDEEKIIYGAIGASIRIKCLEEKFSTELPANFWTTISQTNTSAEQTKAYIEEFKNNNINLGNLSNYVNGKPLEDGVKVSEVSNAMSNAIKSINPGLSDNEIAEKIENLCHEV